MLTKEIIVKSIVNNKTQIQEFGVATLGLFGSYVKNQQHPKSDLDVLISFNDKQETFENFMGIYDFLEALFKDIKIDVVTLKSS